MCLDIFYYCLNMTFLVPTKAVYHDTEIEYGYTLLLFLIKYLPHYPLFRSLLNILKDKKCKPVRYKIYKLSYFRVKLKRIKFGP